MNLSTSFNKKEGKLWTFKNPNGNKAQLDYMLVNRKWRNSVTNCESYNTYKTMDSDHQPCSSKLRLSLRENKREKSKKTNFNWALLLTNRNVSEAYTVEVKNRFQALQNHHDETSADIMYENIIQSSE